MKANGRGAGTYHWDTITSPFTKSLWRKPMRLFLFGLMMLFLVAGMLISVAPAFADEPQKANPPAQKENQSIKVQLVRPHQPDENFQAIEAGSVKVFYMEGWKDAAQKIAEQTDKCIKAALAYISMEPQGTCEITLRPITIQEGALAGSEISTDMNTKIVAFPMAVPEGGADKYSTDSFETKQNIMSAASYMCTMALMLAQPDAATSNPRWFLDGISGDLRLKMAGELAGNDPDMAGKLCPLQYYDKILEHYRDKLLNWDFDTQNDWAYGAGCTQMFIEIEKKFGAEAIKKIVAGFANAQKTDKDSLVKIINDAIGADLVEFLSKYEAPKYPQVGVGADKEFKGPGIRIVSVVQNSAAAKAGFQAEDIILKINGKEVNALVDLQAIVKEAGVGGELKAHVKRGDKEIELAATIGEPAFNFPPDPEPPKAEPDNPADKY